MGLRRTRRPDGGLARAVVAWASGGTLDAVLRDAEVAAGDFVRNVRQVIDLVRQIGQVAADRRPPGTAPTWPWRCCAGGWWGPTTRPPLGSALGDPSPS